MTFWVVKVVRVVKGACLSEERRVKSEKLMCRLICNLPELSIRILIRLLPIF